jgi:hypothetical protein
MRNEMERLITTALHCNPKQMVYGTVTGTTITFGYKFVSAPIILLTPLAASGTPTATVVSKDKTGDYYTGATITSSGATSVDWIAIGTGISA